MTLGISQFDSIEKNFDTMVEQMNELKGYTLDKISKLEDSTNIKKAKHFTNTYLSNTQISLRDSSGWYNKSKIIQLIIPEGFYNGLIDKTLVDGFKDDISWQKIYCKLTIREDNQENLAKFKQILDVIEQEDQKTHQNNLKIAEDNKKLLDTIFNILKQAGISESYYGYKTNRSSKQTKMYYNFPSEIHKQIPTSYSTTTLEENKNKLNLQIDKYWKQEIDKIRQEKIQKEKEQKEKEENRKLALLLAKYDLDLNDEWSDIMDKILDKNKYLRLAYYLEKNRGDWNDGCNYAETGLYGFLVETEIDHKIHDNIVDYIENWGNYMDGRVFRDCEYNYSVIYGMVEDEDLMKDFQVVQEQLQNW